MRKIKCAYCDKVAVYETIVNNVYLCETPTCHSEFAINESSYNEEGFEDLY